MKNLILLGAPGSGKGTLATDLCDEMEIEHISTGDLLRDVAASGSELGLQIKQIISSGELVPDNLIGQMIKDLLLTERVAKKGVMLDGFPRTIAQAEMLQQIMAEAGRQIDKVVYLKIDLAAIIKRLVNRVSCKVCGRPYHLINFPPKVAGKCDLDGGELIKRADDNEETVKKRYDTYMGKTMPLINYYKTQGLLYEVDSLIGRREVVEAVLSNI